VSKFNGPLQINGPLQGWQSGLKIVLSVKLINANMPIHENLSKSIDTY